MEQKYIQTAIDYKKNIAGKFVLVEGAKLKQRVEGERLSVTKKIDGHLQVVFWQDGSVFMLNASGKQRAESLKCLDAFAEAMKAAGAKSATIAAELYLPRPDGRPRCGDVNKALADDALKDQLCLAPFDIIELDGNPWKAEHYGDTHKKLSDSRGIAYQMVKPEMVFEISVLEFVARGNDDKIRMNPLLKFDEAQGWLMEGVTPGVSVLGITLERERTDKQPTETDIRISQITDICPFEEPEGGSAKLEARNFSSVIYIKRCQVKRSCCISS